MKRFGRLLVALFILLLSAQCLAFGKATTTGTITGKFKYKHAECTGQNQWIYVNGRSIPIRFDTKKSNQPAMKALCALLPEVLGPNSDGNITLTGSYETRKIPLPSE